MAKNGPKGEGKLANAPKCRRQLHVIFLRNLITHYWKLEFPLVDWAVNRLRLNFIASKSTI